MTARALHLAGDYQTQLQFTGGLPDKLRELPRIRLFRAFALAWMGDADGAEALLRRDGQWLEVPDVQEGEVSLSELWVHIQELRAKARGEAFDPAFDHAKYDAIGESDRMTLKLVKPA